MKLRSFCCALGLIPAIAFANDSTGYIGVGGIEYLKSPHITMQSEDLFISKNKIRVDYQFKNLSNRDIQETVLFPLPLFERYYDSDFADTAALIRSFTIKVNGKTVKPTTHVRAYFLDMNDENKKTDVTQELKKCGFSDDELMNPWTEKRDNDVLEKKLQACTEPTIVKLRHPAYDENETSAVSPWAVQVVYSWQQNFPAGQTIQVQHQYSPLVGGSIQFSGNPEYPFSPAFCVDDAFRRELKKQGKDEHNSYSVVDYVLKTGANWAKPIGKFTLTIERDKDELVSLCWDKSLRKISATQFQAVKYDFLPKDDLSIVFVK